MSDPISPAHYQGFSRGAEVIDITENLTGNGAQAVQYVARSCRLDGANKGDQIEDIDKAIWFLTRERERLEQTQFTEGQKAHQEALDRLREKLSGTQPEDLTPEDRPLIVGGWYRLADDVDRLGIPVETEWVVVMGLPVAHGAGKVEVAWPHLTAGPLHTRAIIPATHLTGEGTDGPPEDAA